MSTPTLDPATLENRKLSVNTFVEQTKQLISLASAFVVAPAVADAVLKLVIDYRFVIAELGFIVSVLSSYLVLGSVAGSQRKGEYDVYRPATRALGLIQFFTYVTGLAFFVWWLVSQPSPLATTQ